MSQKVLAADRMDAVTANFTASLGREFIKGTVAAFSAAVLFGCAAKQEPRHYARQAPTSQAETGYNVSGLTDADLDQIEKIGGTIRELNAAHAMYEVTGLSGEDLHKAVPKADIEHNRYVENLVGPKAGARVQAAPIEFCADVLPVNITVRVTSAEVRPVQIIKRTRTPLTFKFSAVQRAGPNNPAPVALTVPYIFTVEAPETSVLSQTRSRNAPLTFTPDDMGLYMVRVVTQVNGVVCWTGVPFGVTDTVRYNGPQPVPVIDLNQKLVQFPHLKQLNMPEAWALAQGAGVTVAIVDTGLNYNHPDLSASVALNAREVAGNGVDEDQNGFKDDVVGWNFVSGTNLPYDDHMHGTHCAGLAVGNVGMAPKAKVLPVKVMNTFGGGDLGSIAAGIRYAADRKAKIISVSLGGPELGVISIQRAVQYARTLGALVVVAAGNEEIDIDRNPTFPASFADENILTIAAAGPTGALASYTNTGVVGVDLAAPGGDFEDGGLLSTAVANTAGVKYLKSAGTSMATPVTAGAAALLLSKNPGLTFAQLKTALMNSGDLRADYAGKIRSQRFLNPKAALLASVPLPRPH